MSEKRYIYVPAELASRIEQTDDVAAMGAAVDEYFKNSVKEIAALLMSLDEEVLIYKGLMAKARAEFRKAADEQISQSYAMWEEVDKQRPNVHAKVRALVDDLKPVTDELNKINDLLNCMDLSRIERALKLISELAYAPDETKNMLAFLAQNYKA